MLKDEDFDIFYVRSNSLRQPSK